ncbi:MAG: T9SS type A sorting domain-containing protein [Bacteroidota bacterium]
MTHATLHPRRSLALVLGFCLLLPLAIAACEIVEVIQPSEADQGEVIAVTVTIRKTFEDQMNRFEGVVSVLVPEDWSFVSGEYDGDAGAGDMLEDLGWADSTERVLPAPDGMKWIGTISDEAYFAEADDFYDAILRLQVGQETGTFDLGYFTTTTAFKVDDIDLDPADGGVSADTALNQPITVNTFVSTEDGAQPGAVALGQNYPNPFAASTSIRYTLERAAEVRLTVFDLAGREVAIVAEGTRPAGEHTSVFDAAELPSGAYLYRLEADGEMVETRRMTIVR